LGCARIVFIYHVLYGSLLVQRLRTFHALAQICLHPWLQLQTQPSPAQATGTLLAYIYCEGIEGFFDVEKIYSGQGSQATRTRIVVKLVDIPTVHTTNSSTSSATSSILNLFRAHPTPCACYGDFRLMTPHDGSSLVDRSDWVNRSRVNNRMMFVGTFYFPTRPSPCGRTDEPPVIAYSITVVFRKGRPLKGSQFSFGPRATWIHLTAYGNEEYI